MAPLAAGGCLDDGGPGVAPDSCGTGGRQPPPPRVVTRLSLNFPPGVTLAIPITHHDVIRRGASTEGASPTFGAQNGTT